MSSPFHGLSAFPVTPASADGIVDTDALGSLVAGLVRPGVSSIGVMGSTGGYMYFDAGERTRAFLTAVQAAGDTPVLAGVGDLRTDAVLRHAENAAKAGAAGLLLAPVSYLPLADADVTSLVADVVGASDLPILLYNNPTTTGFSMSEALVAQLSAMEGVAAVKNPPAPGGDFAGQIERLRAACAEGFSLGYSGDAAIAGALKAGCDAWYSVVAGTLPDLAVAMWNARADADELDRLVAGTAPLWQTFGRYGSIRVVYEMQDMLGRRATRLPAPLLPLGTDARGEIRDALEAVVTTLGDGS